VQCDGWYRVTVCGEQIFFSLNLPYLILSQIL
jgi:hypothetical protein